MQGRPGALSLLVAAGLLTLAGCATKASGPAAKADAGSPTGDASQDSPPDSIAGDAAMDLPASDGNANADGNADANCSSGTIFCNGSCLGAGQTTGNCTALVVEPDVFNMAIAGPYLYFSIIGTPIKRVPLAGGMPEVTVVERGHQMVGNSTHLYFSKSRFVEEPAMIRRLAVAGGPAETLTQTLLEADGLAIDASYLYFIREAGFQGMQLTGPAVFRVPLGGGAAQEIGVATQPNWISSDATDIYWADKGVVWKTAKSTAGSTPLGDAGVSAGGAVQVADTRSFSQSSNLYALTDGFVYWTDNARGGLYRAPKAGGGMTEELASSEPSNWPVVDGGDVYFATVSFFKPNQLMRYRTADRTTTALVTVRKDAARNIVVDATSVYLRLTGGVLKIAK